LHKIGALYKLEVCGAPAPLAAEGPEKGGRTQRKGPLEGGPPFRQAGQPASSDRTLDENDYQLGQRATIPTSLVWLLRSRPQCGILEGWAPP